MGHQVRSHSGFFFFFLKKRKEKRNNQCHGDSCELFLVSVSQSCTLKRKGIGMVSALIFRVSNSIQTCHTPFMESWPSGLHFFLNQMSMNFPTKIFLLKLIYSPNYFLGFLYPKPNLSVQNCHFLHTFFQGKVGGNENQSPWPYVLGAINHLVVVVVVVVVVELWGFWIQLLVQKNHQRLQQFLFLKLSWTTTSVVLI